MNTPVPIRPLSSFALDLKNVQEAVLLPDDDTLVLCREPSPRLHLVSLANGSLRTLSGHDGPVNTLALADAGRLLLSGSDDGTVRVWDTRTWATKLVLEGHTDFVRDVAAAGMVAASGSEDHTVRVWDLTDGSCRVLTGHGEHVTSVAVSPDAATVVSTSIDNHLMIWDVETGTGRDLYRSGQRIWRIPQSTGTFAGTFLSLGGNESGKGHPERPSAMLFDADSDTLYTAGDEIIAWDLAVETERTRTHTAAEVGRSLVRHPKSGLLAAATFSQISIYSPEAEYLFGFGSEEQSIKQVVFTGDQRLASVDGTGTVSVWPAITGEETDGLRHPGKVMSIVMDPTGRRAATLCSGKEAMVWDVATGRREATFAARDTMFMAPGQLVFTPDGRSLVINKQCGLDVHDLDTGESSTIEFDMDPENRWICPGFTALDEDTVFVTAATIPPTLISLHGRPPRSMAGQFASASLDPVITPDKRHALTLVNIDTDSPLLRDLDEIPKWNVAGLQCWDLDTGKLAWTRHAKTSDSRYPVYRWFFTQDSDTVLVPKESDELLVLDINTGEVRDRLLAASDKILYQPPHRLADGGPGFFAVEEAEMTLWRITGQELVRDPGFAIPLAEGEKATVELVNPRADLVVTRDGDNSRYRYRLSTGERLGRLEISPEAKSVAATDDGAKIVVGDTTGFVHIEPLVN